MRSTADKAANPGRRRFIKQAAAAGLLTAVASRFPVAYGESTRQRELDMARTILMSGKFATLEPARPRATAVVVRDGVFEVVGSDDEVMRLADEDARVIGCRS